MNFIIISLFQELCPSSTLNSIHPSKQDINSYHFYKVVPVVAIIESEFIFSKHPISWKQVSLFLYFPLFWSLLNIC